MFPDPSKNKKTICRQEGMLSLYPALHPGISCVKDMSEFFSETYEDIWAYFKDKDASMLWIQERSEVVAREFLSHKEFPEHFIKEMEHLHSQIVEQSHKIYSLDLTTLSKEDLLTRYKNLHKVHMRMWGLSIFIDAFDPGYDKEEIDRLTAQHSLSEEEVGMLLNPHEPAWITQMHNALHDLKHNKISKNKKTICRQEGMLSLYPALHPGISCVKDMSEFFSELSRCSRP
jgi:hypothetical protein